MLVTTVDLAPEPGYDHPMMCAMDVEVFTASQLERIKKSPVMHTKFPTDWNSSDAYHSRWEALYVPVKRDDLMLKLFKKIDEYFGHHQDLLTHCDVHPSEPVDLSAYDVVASVTLLKGTEY